MSAGFTCRIGVQVFAGARVVAMKTKSKIWLGVGAFVVAGTGAVGAAGPLAAQASSFTGLPAQQGLAAASAIARAPAGGFLLAQHADHTKDAGEGGESKGLANLPPDLAFGVRLALLRGHLSVGDELVKLKQWNAALPHFLHPIEEIYDDLRGKLADYEAPAFDAALKALADVVKAKKGNDYAKALKEVTDALAAADAGLKGHQADWAGFQAEAAIEAIKSAAGEYEGALVKGTIAKPVEYQDARGFIWQAERMIDSVAPELQKKNAASLQEVRAGLAELKKAFPAAMPPKRPVKDHAALLVIIARIELAAGKLM
jgi:hypothetical protein